MFNQQGCKRNPKGLFLIFIFMLILPASLLSGQEQETSGDQKINNMKEQILKKKKEQAEKEKQAKEQDKSEESKAKNGENEADDKDDDGSHANLFSIFFEAFFRISMAARFADFPYANPDIHGLSTFYFDDKPAEKENAYQDNATPEIKENSLPPSLPKKVAFLTLSSSGAYLGDDIWSSTTRCDANLLPLHINALYQTSFSTHTQFSLFALNGGFSFFLPFLTLNAFGGAFRLDFLGAPMLGLGFSTQIYLPYNFIIDFYNVNAFEGEMSFCFFSGSLNYALNRFNLGLGVEVSAYYSSFYWGPYLRLSLWI